MAMLANAQSNNTATAMAKITRLTHASPFSELLLRPGGRILAYCGRACCYTAGSILPLLANVLPNEPVDSAHNTSRKLGGIKRAGAARPGSALLHTLHILP